MNMIFWDKQTNLIYANGELKTPNEVKADYPFAKILPTVLETSGEITLDDGTKAFSIGGIDNFNILKDNYDIDSSLSNDEALAEIIRIRTEANQQSALNVSATEAKLDYLIMINDNETIV